MFRLSILHFNALPMEFIQGKWALRFSKIKEIFRTFPVSPEYNLLYLYTLEIKFLDLYKPYLRLLNNISILRRSINLHININQSYYSGKKQVD